MINYASSVNITATLASLASGSLRESLAVDNTTTRYDDAEVNLGFKLLTGSTVAPKVINVYVACSIDGTNWTDNATGADAALTIRSPTNLRLARVINVPDLGGLTWRETIPSVASLFGGNLPIKWSIIVDNESGLAFSATEADHTKNFRGIWYTLT